MNDLNEAPVIMFTNYKRTDGFEVSLTLRGSDLKTVATDLDSAIKLIISSGGTPISKNFNKFPEKPKLPEKPCPVHQGMNLKERTGKDGSKYWSHSIGVYPNLTWCNGQSAHNTGEDYGY